MEWYLAALAILLTGGLLALAAGRKKGTVPICAKHPLGRSGKWGLSPFSAGRNARAACLLGTAGTLLGGGVVLIQSLLVLIVGEPQVLRLPWSVPLGSANMELDPLSAVFAAAIALVTMLAAVYGSEYLRVQISPLPPGEGPGVRADALSEDSPHPSPLPEGEGTRNLGPSWFFFSLLTASMLLVVVARNGVLFLMSWELMSLASFFLVTQEDQNESVRRAGWIYLVAMHLGTAFLVAMFLLLGQHAGSLDFDQFTVSPGIRNVLFVLAVIGFGTKAGFIPMHVWLPEAHPAAPSHVSAVMSGVMIKTGIYGLLRVLTLLGEPPAWWGWTLVLMGAISGVLGVLYALSQHDLKRLLAYHSVENIGIIALGLGVGLLGISYRNPAMAALGLTGGLLHVVNHAVFKSLLFFGAGSVLHATGTGEINRLGGLLKRLPTTGATFLIGAAAISGLPPLNGFVSEFLIYLGALAGLAGEVGATPAWPLMSVLVVGGLALIGGLAAACFTKAFGIVFLGEPRSPEAAGAQEAGAAMRWPMAILAGLCIVIGLAAPVGPLVIQPAVATITRGVVDGATASRNIDAGATDGRGFMPVGPLLGIMFGSYVLLGLMVLIVQVRRRLLVNRRVEQAVTWDCGYAAPTPRMQYTASSYARPLLQLFRLFLQPQDEIHEPRGLFPQEAGLHTHTPDLFRRCVYGPAFFGVAWMASKLRWLQGGRIQIYVLYIALTILALLIWKLG